MSFHGVDEGAGKIEIRNDWIVYGYVRRSPLPGGPGSALLTILGPRDGSGTASAIGSEDGAPSDNTCRMFGPTTPTRGCAALCVDTYGGGRLGAVNQTALFLTIWKPSLLAPIKSFFHLLRNSGKKSTANQIRLSRVYLLFGKDLLQVTIRLYARSAMHHNISGSLGGVTLIHLDCHIVARFGLIDRSRSPRLTQTRRFISRV